MQQFKIPALLTGSIVLVGALLVPVGDAHGKSSMPTVVVGSTHSFRVWVPGGKKSDVKRVVRVEEAVGGKWKLRSAKTVRVTGVAGKSVKLSVKPARVGVRRYRIVMPKVKDVKRRVEVFRVKVVAKPKPPTPTPPPPPPVVTPPVTPPPVVPPVVTPPVTPSKFPDGTNTGVPAGIVLKPYSGPMTITTPNVVIDGVTIKGYVNVRAKGVVIKNSRVTGVIMVEQAGSLTLSDSYVDGGTHPDGAVGHYNLTLRRVEVVGARVSVSCGDNCDVEDSWLHRQYIKPGSDWHGDGFLANGGKNFRLVHNTLACDSKPTGNGACSAALAAYGDFDPIENLLAENNLFVASPAGYCLYGGYDTLKPYGKQAKNVRIINNTFERGSNGKCGVYGPAANVASGFNGNVFSGNKWDDGSVLDW